MTTPLDDYRCARCDHIARRHTAFIGPCADCWKEMIEMRPPCLDSPVFCPKFLIREEDREEIMALKF